MDPEEKIVAWVFDKSSVKKPIRKRNIRDLIGFLCAYGCCFLLQTVFMELQMVFDEGSDRKVTVIVTVQFFVAHFLAFSGLQEGFLVQLDIIKIVSCPLRNKDGRSCRAFRDQAGRVPLRPICFISPQVGGEGFLAPGNL